MSVHRRIERQGAECVNSQRQIHRPNCWDRANVATRNNDDSLVAVPARAIVDRRQLDQSRHVIDFPNHSRSYDRTRRAVRFWGYDSAIEASFFINEDALNRIQPDAHLDEAGFLNAFDSNRDLICAAAAKVYVRGSRGSYDLVAANF
jgi:hypothetical protein